MVPRPMNLRSSSAISVRLRDRLKASAHGEILAAAERVFSRDGLSARMDAVAREAGVAVGTLYNHFDDRDRLLAELNEAQRVELLGRLDARVDPAQTGRAQVEAMALAVLDHVEAHAPFMRILMESEHGHRRVKPVMEVLYERTQQVVKRALRRKELRADDADLWPSLLLGMLRGVMIRRMKLGPGRPPDQVAQAVTRTFFDGAAPRRRP